MKRNVLKFPKITFNLYGNLIHGSGTNNGSTIRFAIVFGIIEKRSLLIHLKNHSLLDQINPHLLNRFFKIKSVFFISKGSTRFHRIFIIFNFI